MNRPWLYTLIFAACTLPTLGQTIKLKKGDRPVLLSAQTLATACEDWIAINPGGHRPKSDDTLNVSPEQIVQGVSCEWYILGYQDRGMEAALGSHYHPIPSQIDDLKPLIDTFLKYVKDHPEKQDFAASTVLGDVKEILVKTQTGR
jgi:hypothetical protein